MKNCLILAFFGDLIFLGEVICEMVNYFYLNGYHGEFYNRIKRDSTIDSIFTNWENLKTNFEQQLFRDLQDMSIDEIVNVS